jgi:hypothetical protein
VVEIGAAVELLRMIVPLTGLLPTRVERHTELRGTTVRCIP